MYKLIDNKGTVLALTYSYGDACRACGGQDGRVREVEADTPQTVGDLTALLDICDYFPPDVWDVPIDSVCGGAIEDIIYAASVLILSLKDVNAEGIWIAIGDQAGVILNA